MAKVFVGGQEGRALADKGANQTLVIDDKRPKREAAPPLEMKAGDGASPPVVDGPGERKDGSDTDHIDAEDRDLSDITIEEARKAAQRKITKYANRWQTELKAKERLAEEVAESERFAENLFNERELLRKQVEEANARAAALEAAKPKAPEFVAPDEKDTKYYNDKGEFQWKQFSTDNAAYEAKKAIVADRQVRAEQEAKAAQEAQAAAFKERIAKAQEKYPDWEKVVTSSPIMMPNEALAYIAQSDYGTDIAYFLAKNPTVGEKIKALHPIRAIAAIRDIETGFEKPAPKVAPAAPAASSETVERQGAPAPITPIAITGTNPPVMDPAKMSFKQLREYERQRAKRR
jgi:hypothetical protein